MTSRRQFRNSGAISILRDSLLTALVCLLPFGCSGLSPNGLPVIHRVDSKMATVHDGKGGTSKHHWEYAKKDQ